MNNQTLKTILAAVVGAIVAIIFFSIYNHFFGGFTPLEKIDAKIVESEKSKDSAVLEYEPQKIAAQKTAIKWKDRYITKDSISGRDTIYIPALDSSNCNNRLIECVQDIVQLDTTLQSANKVIDKYKTLDADKSEKISILEKNQDNSPYFTTVLGGGVGYISNGSISPHAGVTFGLDLGKVFRRKRK